MSWQKARQEAEMWITQMKLAKVKGEYLDLKPYAGALAHKGAFKNMVIQAARRILLAKGAKRVDLPPEDPVQE
ncbi:MAG TPA: hypothetical protein VGO11_19770 [Chthoniobacteraceae bacterium]|jgi:hypothetical protein|nr:hypothetical protein [Chthoniobacteraceae bacterium]